MKNIFLYTLLSLFWTGCASTTAVSPPPSSPSQNLTQPSPETSTETPTHNEGAVVERLLDCNVSGKYTKLQPGHAKWVLGQAVHMRGVALEKPLMCTKKMCTEADPCCNRCFGSMGLKGFDNVEFRGLECKGDRCTTTCDMPSGTDIKVYGRVVDVRGLRALVEIDSSCVAR